MKTATIYNSDLHFEHKQWSRELLFWEDELKSFQNRLDELVVRWTDDRVLAELGQYQNQFTIHKNKINDLKEDIDLREHKLFEHLKENEGSMDRVYLKFHLDLRKRMETQRDIYNDLKYRFFRFLSKYM